MPLCEAYITVVFFFNVFKLLRLQKSWRKSHSKINLGWDTELNENTAIRSLKNKENTGEHLCFSNEGGLKCLTVTSKTTKEEDRCNYIQTQLSHKNIYK
jgi:hypothetical protein